jgi:lycopene beta-cyclase
VRRWRRSKLAGSILRPEIESFADAFVCIAKLFYMGRCCGHNAVMSKECDVVIAGAGLAGLSLAAELAKPEFAHLRVVLIEPRSEYVRDRTWSFWDVPNALPARWRYVVQTRWHQWRVSYEDRSVVRSGELAYASVRADAFYEQALQEVAKVSHIHWLKETGVDQVRAQPVGIELMTSTGERLCTQILFDSRPPALAQSNWVQQFKGWEITSRQACFDMQCLDLMAFEQSPQGMHFIYCLPYSATQALVESTWIKRADGVDNGEAELREALAKRWACTDYEITFREQGALPLWPSMPATLANVVRIGRTGGALRASTGYAFCASLHQSAALASSLSDHLQGKQPLQAWRAPVFKNSALDTWMDEVLFRVLERDWRQAPRYFVDLFERVPADVLTRFLHGASSWQDRIAVMRALPPAPFLRAALTWRL